MTSRADWSKQAYRPILPALIQNTLKVRCHIAMPIKPITSPALRTLPMRSAPQSWTTPTAILRPVRCLIRFMGSSGTMLPKRPTPMTVWEGSRVNLSVIFPVIIFYMFSAFNGACIFYNKFAVDSDKNIYRKWFSNTST